MVCVPCTSLLLAQLVALTKVYQVEYIPPAIMSPYRKDRGSCEISEEVKKKNGYLKTYLEAKALYAPQEVSDFGLCSTCGCCC